MDKKINMLLHPNFLFMYIPISAYAKIRTNFCLPILRSLHMKFELNFASGVNGDDWK